MPELPEVETIRRQLEREIVGKKIKTVEVKDADVLKRNKSKKAFVSTLEGAKLKNLQRVGTYLQFTLDTGDFFYIDLGTQGRLLKASAKDEMDEGTAIVIVPTTGGHLRYIDPKATGELFVTTADERDEVFPERGELGIDVVDTPVSWTAFAKLVLQREMKLKTLLTDQHVLAGLGPLYSDEILWDAGLRYDRMSNELSIQEVRRLYRALVEKLHDAVKHGGSTLADGVFLDLHGEAGGFREYHEVYQRDGEACRRCRAVVGKAKFSGRNVYFCEQCQV